MHSQNSVKIYYGSEIHQDVYWGWADLHAAYAISSLTKQFVFPYIVSDT